ncbi:MAG: cytochrome c-type biogenesis protein CcmH [Burkholderiales bacterium]|nr:cytochrome c-type biogenesis protein CcmH [Burkholderiales bacterium]
MCLWAQPVTRPDVPLAPMAAAEAERFHVLTQELRCVVCQNENLADSTAPLAQDLKREIREQMLAGKSDDDIKAFLVARYGDFVTYRPPVRANTLLLWGGPLVFVVVAGWLWVRNRATARGPVQPVDKSFGDNA